MKKLLITDKTLQESSVAKTLTFKEKIEIAKLLDKLKLSVIELAPITDTKIDPILVRTISACVKNSTIAIPVNLTSNGANEAWDAVKNAAHPRLQIIVPMSTVQMEYICHKKPDKVIEMIKEITASAKALCGDIEFVASDATRSERDFLRLAVSTAIEAGATTVTVCDTAGEMITDEFIEFISTLISDVPELKDVKLGINASNELSMATSTVLSAIKLGIDEVKTASCICNTPSLEAVLKILRARADSLGIEISVGLTEFQRVSRQIMRICDGHGSTPALTDFSGKSNDEFILDSYADISTVSDVVASLGYELSDEDMNRVYEEFKRAAEKKKIGTRELDAIVASSAMQVPATFKLVSYVINSGNVISSTANITLEKDGKALSGVCIGDGPIDAAFLAIEQIIGHHYELDDFSIKSVTEGREAIGSAFIKLRDNGKVYSGNGISTDIIGASIRAYISALNKIVYENN